MSIQCSLIMTVYNRASYLGLAIESVLAQTFPHWELIIWDDGSTDNSVNIARHYAQQDKRIRVIAAPHRGRNAALIAAHELAQGDYVGWLDSDDQLAPTALEKTSQILDQQPEVGMVYTDHYLMNEAGDVNLHQRAPQPYNKEALLLDFITFHFRLIRKTVFNAAGGINPHYPSAIDYDLSLRISEITKVHQLTERLYYYRLHPQTISRQQRLQQIYASRNAMLQALERRGLAERYEIELRIIAKANDPKQLRGLYRLRRKSKTVFSPMARAASWVLGALQLSATMISQPVWAQSIQPAQDGTGTILRINGNQINIGGGQLSKDGANLFQGIWTQPQSNRQFFV
jgi:glycosyltransferase involved in cell wall biosynthesis